MSCTFFLLLRGVIVTVALFYLIGSYAAGGVLLPMGYGQGPGQAYNWGSIYQGYTEYPAFRNGASFGLTIAAMGFISASVGGVYYLNKLRRAGDKRAQVVNAEEIEDLSAEMVTGKDEIPLSESLDKRPLSPGTSREASGVPCLNPRRGLTLLSPVCRDPAIGV